MRATVLAASRIARKDLRQRIRDRSAVLLAVVLPLALAAIFDVVFGPATEQRPFTYVVVDQDGGPIASAFTEDVLARLAGDGVLTLHAETDATTARRRVDDGDVGAAFVLPAGFSDAVRTGQAASIHVIGDADAPTGTEVARSLAGAFTAELTSVRLAAGTVASLRPGATEAELAVLAERAAATARPVVLAESAAATKVLDPSTYFAAGMAVFFLFFTVQFGVSSLLDERAGGTLTRLLAAPVSRGAILAGKLATSVLLGVISMLVLVVATSVLLGANWGDPLGVGVLVVAGVLAATSVTAVVASLARTSEQAGNAQAVIAVVLGILGGVFFPIAQVGGLTAMLSLLTPHAWFLRGLGELAGGGSVASVLPAAGVMLAFAVVVGGIALSRLRTAVAS